MKQLNPAIATDAQQAFHFPAIPFGAAILVTLNGTILQPGDFTRNGHVITLAQGVRIGDEVGVVVF